MFLYAFLEGCYTCSNGRKICESRCQVFVGWLQVRLHTDKVSGQSKGYAHVHFVNEEGLEKAIAMSGHNLAGRNLKISYAQKKK